MHGGVTRTVVLLKALRRDCVNVLVRNGSLSSGLSKHATSGKSLSLLSGYSSHLFFVKIKLYNRGQSDLKYKTATQVKKTPLRLHYPDWAVSLKGKLKNKITRNQ